jgi:hypothetical protein
MAGRACGIVDRPRLMMLLNGRGRVWLRESNEVRSVMMQLQDEKEVELCE